MPTGYTAPGPPAQPLAHRVAPSGELLAEFGERLLARLIDGAVLTGVGMVIMVPAFVGLFAVMGTSFQVQPDGTVDPDDVLAGIGQFFGIFVLVLVLIMVATYVYEVELVRRTGQTLGKRALKLRVVQLEPTARSADGYLLSRGLLTRRWLASNVAGVFIPFYQYLDGFWQLWDQPYRQCLHDKFASTVVVKVNP